MTYTNVLFSLVIALTTRALPDACTFTYDGESPGVVPVFQCTGKADSDVAKFTAKLIARSKSPNCSAMVSELMALFRAVNVNVTLLSVAHARDGGTVVDFDSSFVHTVRNSDVQELLY